MVQATEVQPRTGLTTLAHHDSTGVTDMKNRESYTGGDPGRRLHSEVPPQQLLLNGDRLHLSPAPLCYSDSFDNGSACWRRNSKQRPGLSWLKVKPGEVPSTWVATACDSSALHDFMLSEAVSERHLAQAV